MPKAMDYVGHDGSFDVTLKKAVLTWREAVRFGETLDLDCEVSRWGRTSFDVRFAGSVAGGERFDVVVTYVNVTPGTGSPAPVTDEVKARLG
jgi:acyl-CoA thioesterase FadM